MITHNTYSNSFTVNPNILYQRAHGLLDISILYTFSLIITLSSSFHFLVYFFYPFFIVFCQILQLESFTSSADYLWRRKRQPTRENPVDRGACWAVVHGVAQSRRWLKRLSMHACIREGNGNPLQCSCLENPRDGEAWWAAGYGVAQSDTTEAT